MKKDVLIIAHFSNASDTTRNNRFNYICDLLSKHNFNVELVTSDFSHLKKEKRDKSFNSINYKVTYISEPKYNKNISLKRFYSHYIMSKNLKKYLQNRKKPDVIYCAVPSLDLAKEAAKYANDNEIRFIIDVQDLWPEAFKMVMNLPILNQLIYTPLKKRANYIYRSADDILAVSETYLNRVKQINEKANQSKSIYIGTDLEKVDRILNVPHEKQKQENEFWIAYVGTLGSSYDISSIINAVKLLQDEGYTKMKLVIMGDGPLRTKFEKEADQQNVKANFTGSLDYEEMLRLLNECDIAINPIIGGSAASIINKHADYAATGLPVINTQESKEYKKLVETYNMGLNSENGNIKELAKKIFYLYENPKERKEMSKNSRRLAEEKFDRSKTYVEIVNLLTN